MGRARASHLLGRHVCFPASRGCRCCAGSQPLMARRDRHLTDAMGSLRRSPGVAGAASDPASHLRTSKPAESSQRALRIACPLLKEPLPRLGLRSTWSSFGFRQSRRTPPVHVRMSIFSAIFDGVIDFDAKHVPSHPLQNHPLARRQRLAPCKAVWQVDRRRLSGWSGGSNDYQVCYRLPGAHRSP